MSWQLKDQEQAFIRTESVKNLINRGGSFERVHVFTI